MRRWSGLLIALAWLVCVARVARADVADYLGKPIVSVRLELEGRTIAEADLQQVLVTTVDTPLSMLDVRETVSRLFSLGRFEDIRVHADPSGAGVALVYELLPVHPVDRITFTGAVGQGIGTAQLRRDLVDRFGASPPVGRAPELAAVVQDALHAEGYLHAAVTSHAELRHAPDRATLIFALEPGFRTHVADVEVTGTPGLSRAEVLKILRVRPGDAYRSDAIATRISNYVDNRRAAGYFEAKLTTSTRMDDGDRVVHLTVNAVQGPRVRVVFRGDPLPADRRAELVPIEREGSTDEDLLEDSSNRIEDFLRGQGYRDAAAPHVREESNGDLVIAFDVTRGPQYRVARIEISGNQAVPLSDFAAVLRVHEGQPFAASRLDADAAAIEAFYRRQGFASVRVQADDESAPHDANAATVNVTARIDIVENARTVVSSVHVKGNASVPEAELVDGLGLQAGRPLFTTQLAADRDAIQQHYANMGFQSATVEGDPGLSADRTKADVVFTVSEGPRLFVEHILIVGNVRTKTETIERELQFQPGDPLGLSAVNETQQRLASLGLFRRTDVTAIGRGENARDVIVRVDEAPATTISFGGGAEASQLQVTGANGVAQTKLEFAPRAFFEVGRRNLFGKNRSVNLFTRFSLRTKDQAQYSADQQLEGTKVSAFGFAEYRVLGTFREPRLFGTRADGAVTGALEQQHRSGFDFARRSFDVSVGRRITRSLSATGDYQLQRVQLFNDHISEPADQLLIDRAFPQVRLSSFSSSLINSTKNDPLDPTQGTYLSLNGQVAARAIGSEIGFVKSYARAQWFHALPSAHGTVLATNVTLGLARPLARQVVGADGATTTVSDLPASERFFAGGDTTVRGFALDQLGVSTTTDRNTIDQTTGFAIGGAGLVILNAELRTPYHKFEFVTFFDSGNVFAHPSDIDLTELRSSVGFGFRYKSPVGPIRVDLGFKTHRLVIAGERESLAAIHISLGQAF